MAASESSAQEKNDQEKESWPWWNLKDRFFRTKPDQRGRDGKEGEESEQGQEEPGAPQEPQALFSKPWRKINWGDNEDNLMFVKNYNPPEGRQLRILLHGQVGAGKSSLINSIQSVLLNRIYTQALADNISSLSFTKEYTTYKILKEDELYSPFVFNDIMGLQAMQGVKVDDIKLALKGHVKEGYKFNPASPLSEDDQFYNKEPKPNDKVCVLVCVVPADTMSINKAEVMDNIRAVREEASKLHIPQLAIITKIELSCREIGEDLRNVYKVPILKKKMEMFSAEVGIPMNCIFPVKNYHEEIDMDEDINALILSAMRHIINCGDDFIRFDQNRAASS